MYFFVIRLVSRKKIVEVDDEVNEYLRFQMNKQKWKGTWISCLHIGESGISGVAVFCLLNACLVCPLTSEREGDEVGLAK